MRSLPRPPLRPLLLVPGFVARVALAAVVAVLALLALVTQTGVGRDATRRSLESAFARQFDGTLSIGRLDGSAFGRLDARDVVIRTATGDTLLTVARVRALPTWRGLRRQSFEMRSLDLDRPHLRLRRDRTGRWRVVRPRRTPTGPPWDLGAPVVRVTGGRIDVANAGPAPGVIERRAVADLLNARYDGLDGSASVEWTRARRLVLLERLRGTVTPDGGVPTTFDEIAGQFVQAGAVTTLAGLRVVTGATDLGATLRLTADTSAAGTPGRLRLDRIAGRIDGTADADALRRLVPAMPVAGRLRLGTALDVRAGEAGAVEAVLRGLDVRSGDARVTVAGALTLALDADSLRLTTGPAAVRLTAADLARTLPRLAPRVAPLVGSGTRADLDRLHLALDRTAGPGAPPRLFVSTAGRVTAPDADLDGHLALSRTLAGTRWDVDATVRRADLDRLARAAGRPGLRLSPDGATALAGRIASTGSLEGGPAGSSLLDRLTVDARVALGASVLAGRRLDSLRWDGRVDRGGRLAGTFALAQRLDRGVSRARGRVETTLAGTDRRVRLDATLAAFDAGALLPRPTGPDALRSRLSGTVRADLRGATLADLRGTLDARLTAATLQRGPRVATLGAVSLAAALADRPGADDRVTLVSDALSADLTGTLRRPALARHAAFFARRLAAVGRASVRPRGSVAGPDVPRGLPDGEAVRVSGRVQVRDASALGALLPVGAVVGRGPEAETLAAALATTGGDLDATVDARVDAGGLRLAVDAASGRLRSGTRRIYGLRAGGTLADDGVSDPVLDLRGRADSLFAPRRLGASSLDVALLAGTGTFAVSADDGQVVAEGTIERPGPPDAAAGSGAIASPLRLVLRRAALAREGLRLTAVPGATLDVYRDALVVPGLVLDAERLGVAASALAARQQVVLRGVVSARPADTLRVVADGIDVGKLLGKRPERAPLGGTLDANVALSAVLGPRDIVGTVRVERLVMGPFVAGDLTARAYFRPGDDTSAAAPIRLDLALVPGRDLSDGDRLRASRVEASGTFRLPDALPGSPTRDGALDLAFTATRLDASVLDALFPDLLVRTTGTITGQGTVTGSLRRPDFGGDLAMTDVRLSIPRFGLAYTARGTGRLTGDGLALSATRLSDPTGGQLDVSGRIDFNRYRFISLDLRGSLREALVLNVPTSNELPFYGRLWASGEATVTGPVQHAVLRAPDIDVSARSEASIPIRTTFAQTDTGFLVFADSAGRLPDLNALTERESVFRKPEAERTFVDGLDMEINLTAAPGSTVNLVMDRIRGDVMRARGSGRLQLARRDGEFTLFGGLDVTGGDYLFTAGDLFARRFRLDGGAITWDGDPIDPALAVSASYRTRASLAGLPQAEAFGGGLVPLIVRLDLGDRLQSPSIGLSLALDRAARSDLTAEVQGLETLVNQPERQAEYATSVLLTNSFLLTTSLTTGENVSGAGNRLAFASLSQLVGAQINRYLSSVVPGLEFTLGLDGAQASDLDVSAGVALRLLDERLVIRGEGVFATESTAAQPQGLRGAFVVEVRLSPAVSVEVYYRREDDALERLTSAATNTTGASLSYRTTFTTWGALWRRLTGRR